MKTIVISGARSGVGKTTLAKEVARMIPGSVFVKIGHHGKHPTNADVLYGRDATFQQIHDRHADAACLIIESNTILYEMTPDCVVYLSGDNAKPSARIAKEKADIIRGQRVDDATISALSARLELDAATMRRIAWLAGARPSPLTAIILAGGKSSRMGSNKALLEVDGMPLVQRVYQLVRPWCDEVLLSGDVRALVRGGARGVSDRYPGCGPLAGIHACLDASRTEHNLVVACDMPNIDRYAIFALLAQSHGVDIVASSFGGGRVEPLLAFYRRRVALVAQALLQADRLAVRGLFDECPTRIHEFPGASWYRNLNTPDEYHHYVSETRTSQAGAA
jgi:molybdopterin-guanine dinucleotide biosynthesis protein A